MFKEMVSKLKQQQTYNNIAKMSNAYSVNPTTYSMTNSKVMFNKGGYVSVQDMEKKLS